MLTEEDKARIEANRQRALALRAARLQQRQKEEAEQQQQEAAATVAAAAASAPNTTTGSGVQELLSEGGFTRDDDDDNGGEEEGGGGGAAAAVAARPPPARVALAPTNPEGGGCEVCGSSMVDEGFRKAFGIPVCYACKAAHEDEYGLVSKGEAAGEYCLQEGTIRVMPFLERRNPRHAKFQAMKLYCRKQLRAKAHERWGGAEGLEEERDRRRKRKYEAALSKTVDVFSKKDKKQQQQQKPAWL